MMLSGCGRQYRSVRMKADAVAAVLVERHLEKRRRAGEERGVRLVSVMFGGGRAEFTAR